MANKDTLTEINEMSPMERSAFDKVVWDATGKPIPADHEGRKKIVDEAKQAAREAKNEMKRETRGQAKFKKGGAIKSASARADGIAKKGKTKGKIY